MRLSRQRRMVLDLLWSERSHLSARDIFEKLNARGRSIGHTSVYQNLEALQSAGVIECLDRANGRLYGYRSDPTATLPVLRREPSKTSTWNCRLICSIRLNAAPASALSRTPFNSTVGAPWRIEVRLVTLTGTVP